MAVRIRLARALRQLLPERRWPALLLLALIVVARSGSARPAVRPALAQAVANPILEPDDGRGPVLDLIASARTSLDLAIYELTDRRIISALTVAAGRGVQVRVLAEPLPGGRAANARGLAELRQAGAQTRDSSPSFYLTHEKALIVDGAAALIMTFNLTAGSFSSDRDAAILDGDAGDVAEIEAAFQADWERRAFVPAQPALVWSPDNARARLLSLIASASASISVDAEELTDAGMVAALADAAGAGVRVRLVMTDHGARDSSRAGRAALLAAGAEVRLLAAPYIHAKLILVDGAAAFAGSENLSPTSLNRNRELGIITTDGAVLARLSAAFEQDWRRALPESITLSSDGRGRRPSLRGAPAFGR